jgi:serine/threonine protein kinase
VSDRREIANRTISYIEWAIRKSRNLQTIVHQTILNRQCRIVTLRSMAAPDPVIIGRYEVVSRLGQGGMGSLYLARDPKIGRLVAIKLVRQEFDSPDARQRFAREAQSAGTLRHPNIVTIFDVDEHDGLPFIAMEYIDGETLGEIVKRKALLPITKRLQWVEDLCNGLAYAHRQGVIHRDIKPANLMVDTEGSLKILDFGLARRDASKFTQSHVIIGTPNYMSPEQIRGANIDTRSDIFSVGALLYEVLAYKEAFPGAVHQTMHKILHEEPELITDIVPGLDPGVVRILARALVKDRDGRYPDLSQMKNDLTEVRQRMEVAPLADAQTMPLGRDARFNLPATETIKATPISSGSPRRSSHASKRFQSNRQSLQRRRSEQITALLDEARKLFESGDLDKARDKCDEALMFDPDHPGGLQLMDDIASESDRKQIAQWIQDARGELQKGQLDRAEALVAQARQMQPESSDVHQLQEAIDTTRREIERTRQIQETMRRARARFAEGGYEAAIRAAGEVLAIDPENVSAKDLQKRAQEAIENAANRAERDAAAQSAVASARKLFEHGDRNGAIRQLESFTPKHDLVSAFLATLKGEKMPEPDPTVRIGTSGETAHILRGARGEAPNLPARRNFLIAAAVFSVAIVSATLYFQPWQREQLAAPSPALNQSPPSATQAEVAPAPVAPPPLPPVLAPKSPVDTEPTVDQKDIEAAYNAISANDIPRAQRLAATIRKRNPKYPLLASLNTAIETRIADLKKREEAIAEAAKTAAALEEEKKRTAAARKDAEDAKAAAPIATVLPGGGFAAASEPPSPLLRGEAERPEIDKLVQQWASALGTRNVAAISNIRSFTKDEADSWQRIYKNFKQVEVVAKVTATPEVVEDHALVPVEEIMITTQNNGIKLTGAPRRTNYRMHKVGGQWRMLPPTAPMPKPNSLR